MIDAEYHPTPDADKTAATKALPRLRALRNELESRAGMLHVDERKHTIQLVACGLAAGVAFLYALWGIFAEEPRALAWLTFCVLSAAAFALYVRRKGAATSRAEVRDGLHAKMRTVGQHIERAERAARK